MDGDSNGENLSIAFDAKSDYRTNLGEIITFHSNGIKSEDIGILSPQALSSVVTVAPDGSISSGGLPVGTYLSVTSPNGSNLGEQVILHLQPMNDGVVDVCEDLKADFGNTVTTTLVGSPANKINGTTQLLNGGVQPQFFNIQGLNGVSQIMGIPGLQGLGSQSSMSPATGTQTINTIAHSANNAISNANYVLQPMPQNVGLPQYVLAGGQLLQSIQGAQFFIPQPANIAPQQIMTIPFNQNTNGQLVQLVTPNGEVITTTMNSLQSFGTHQAPPQTMITNNFQGLCQTQVLPQILTNSAGQILAVSPQIISQPSGLVQVYGTNQMQLDKQPPLLQQASKPLPMSQPKTVVACTSTTGPSNVPNQSHLQFATIADQSQIASQNVQRSCGTPNQIIQVAQTSSPSVTSTESSTPISQTNANTVDGINLEEIKDFAKAFKIRRLSLGLTQTQVGQALSITEGPAYSQSAICRFEKLDITPKSAQKIKPVLERWMKEAEERYKNGEQNLTEFIGTEPSKKRKRRTSFTPQALDILNQHFERSTHPSGVEMTDLAESLQYDREVVRVWFCNKRQTLKNTVKKLKTVSLTIG